LGWGGGGPPPAGPPPPAPPAPLLGGGGGGGGVNLLEPSGPVQACTGIVVPSYGKGKVYLVQEQIANHQRTLFKLEKSSITVTSVRFVYARTFYLTYLLLHTSTQKLVLG